MSRNVPLDQPEAFAAIFDESPKSLARRGNRVLVRHGDSMTDQVT